MKVVVDTDIVKDSRWDIGSFFLLLSIKCNPNIYNSLDNLLSKEAVMEFDDEMKLTPHTNEEVNSILLDCIPTLPKRKDLEEFAKELMRLVPQGRMGDTPYYYKCNKREICVSLQKFYNFYDPELKYNNEQIKKAVSKYVQSFNGDYTYMQLLRNFIYKPDKTTGDCTSELASYLENMEEEYGK